MYQSILPEDAFFGRGPQGPMAVITDNCDELRDALRAVWPNSKLFLCVFHILQQVNRPYSLNLIEVSTGMLC